MKLEQTFEVQAPAYRPLLCCSVAPAWAAGSFWVWEMPRVR